MCVCVVEHNNIHKVSLTPKPTMDWNEATACTVLFQGHPRTGMRLLHVQSHSQATHRLE